MVTMYCMSVIKQVSIKLQNNTNDLAYVYLRVKDVISHLKAIYVHISCSFVTGLNKQKLG